MALDTKIATVFGGTGFVGRQIVRELANQGYRVKVATRVPERAFFLRPCGAVGQIVPFACDYNDPKSLAAAVENATVVVNCIGILYQKGRARFQKAHVDIPGSIAKACKKAKVDRFVHISALGIEQSGSQYAKTKLEGEKAVKKAFPRTTVLRPSVVFGPGDNFFNMFAEMARYVPFLPLIGGGETKFQPVYVGDVADAVMAALQISDIGAQNPCGDIFDLGGPEVLTLRDIYERMFFYTCRRRKLIGMSYGFAKIHAFFMGLLPKPLLTRDQVESLKTDNIVGEKAKGLQELGVEPTGMGMILPEYLETYCPGGRYNDKKRA